jgi:hypothetical protein
MESFDIILYSMFWQESAGGCSIKIGAIKGRFDRMWGTKVN